MKDQSIENNNPKSDGGTVWGGDVRELERDEAVIKCVGEGGFATRSNKLESQTLGNGKTDQIFTKISQILF